MRTADARRFRTGRMCLDFLHTGDDGLGLLQTPAALAHSLAFVTGCHASSRRLRSSCPLPSCAV